MAELEKATDEFNTRRKLGEGGSGCVYHGIMEDGSDVAVKLLKRLDQDRDHEREFISEVEMLSRLHHRNLVKLIGICIEGHSRCLVYELVRNGSVESHLHGMYSYTVGCTVTTPSVAFPSILQIPHNCSIIWSYYSLF